MLMRSALAVVALAVAAVAAPSTAPLASGDQARPQERPRPGRPRTAAPAEGRRTLNQGSRTGTGSVRGVVHRVRTRPADAPALRSARQYEPDRPVRALPAAGQTARQSSSPSSSTGGGSDPLPPPPELEDAMAAAGAASSSSSSGSTWVLFRNTVVGTSGADAVEPTAANDRNGILVTGNFYANTSSDNGLTVSATALDPTDEQVYGGFCCDQVAYAVDRGSYSLVFWLIQYRYGFSAKRNALKLRIFRGRSSLLAQADTCDWNFEPRDFGLDPALWFDFNQVSHTSTFLYFTTNVRDADKGKDATDASDDPRVGAAIVRIGLDDLDDGNCQIDYRYWYEDGHPYISPVQNAGSTMYLATHVPGVFEGDNLRIYSIADGSNALEKKDKDISNYKDVEGHCPLPDGRDPCEDQHEGRMSGFRSGNTIGWLWMGDQGGTFPFPHVRVAVFETPSLDKVLEHQIWSRDFAWQLPTVGVNQAGALGVVLYAMGGGRFPKAQGFILDNPRNWSGITMHAIAASTSGTDGWGHFASVRPYGNCPNTFLASVYTSDGGTQQGRLVWFGKERDGCADLDVSTVMVLPATVARGATLSVTQVTRNIGSATAGASTTRYYLSRDGAKSSDDLLLSAETAVPSLVRNGSVTGPPATAVIPASASGVYRILACADDRAAVAEITDTNNCVVGVQSVTVK
ncbi:MAG: CARDB domain-containing protein [Vicinamibacterales bacterium]